MIPFSRPFSRVLPWATFFRAVGASITVLNSGESWNTKTQQNLKATALFHVILNGSILTVIGYLAKLPINDRAVKKSLYCGADILSAQNIVAGGTPALQYMDHACIIFTFCRFVIAV